MVEAKLMPGENSPGAALRVAREQRRPDAAGAKCIENFHSPFMENAGVRSFEFVPVEDGMGPGLLVGGHMGDLLQDADILRQANVTADGVKVEEFLGQCAIHVENDQAVTTGRGRHAMEFRENGEARLWVAICHRLPTILVERARIGSVSFAGGNRGKGTTS